MMNLLFEIPQSPRPDISGLSYLPDFISKTDAEKLIQHINSLPWLEDLKRRVQHYGYKYDYKARMVGKDAYLGEIPDWLMFVRDKLVHQEIFSMPPDQVIVNEYLPGQGISAHIDCVPCFGETIASLTLGSPCVMQFSNPRTQKQHEIYLSEQSLIVFSGTARYEWQHAIPARKSDVVNGFKIPRGRRISLTFRTMILS